METKSIIEKLAQPGWVIRTEDLGGHDGYQYLLQRVEGYHLTSADIQRLSSEGWLEPFNGGFRLSDEGRKAYMRSTDELGDGKLIAPANCEHGIPRRFCTALHAPTADGSRP